MGVQAQRVTEPGAGAGGCARPATCMWSGSSWDLCKWEAEMFPVPGCSRATRLEMLIVVGRPDTTAMGSLGGMINIGSSQWLSGRLAAVPTAMQ